MHLPRFSSKKTVSKILDGTISQEMIEKGGQYEESVKPRLLALVSLEAMLDNNFTFYSFMPRFYSFFTSIKADYLIARASSLLRKLNHSLMKPEAKSETLPSLPRTMVGRDFSISLNFRADFIHNISTKVWSTSGVAVFLRHPQFYQIRIIWRGGFHPEESPRFQRTECRVRPSKA